ncbi:hypothetical protein PCANB_001985 [Pneumocystis canis]|nr:hypothetical protein PCANB_001985 [Pneumocystis canis]
MLNNEKLLEEAGKCSGMYAKHKENKYGSSIKVEFDKLNNMGEVDITYIIFEWKDLKYIGKKLPSNNKTLFICNSLAIHENLCDENDINTFLINPDKKNTSIVTQKINVKKSSLIEYKVNKTGYYCISSIPSNLIGNIATIRWNNYYGKLQASEYPKLSFYAFMIAVYLFIGLFWSFFYIKHKNDILSIQKYIMAIIIFLIFEMIILREYYEYININGYNTGSFIYLLIVSMINAGRISFSFFILLIISMGYSIVKTNLGSKMRKSILLSILHFLFSIIYIILTALNYWKNFIPFILILTFLSSSTLWAFYCWTIYSLTQTITDLTHRKQYSKALIYKKLLITLIFTILLILIYSIFRIIFIFRENILKFASSYWRFRWFVLYGFLDILYLTVFITNLILWRPSSININLAMSDDIFQDFEVDDLDFNGTRDMSSSSSLHRTSQDSLNTKELLSNKIEKVALNSNNNMFSITKS